MVDPSPLDPRVDLLAGHGLPVVTIERDLGRPDDPWYVAGETAAGTRQMLDHLREQGARRICLLVQETGWGWTAETLRTYDSWTREQDAPRLVVPVAMQSGEEGAFQAAGRLLAERTRPDAIFVVASRFIRGVQRAAKDAGLRVPDELLIAAGVDSVHAREGNPPVTALDLHPERQAEAAVQMLLARLDDSEAPAKTPAPRHIPATLQARPSTGAR